MNLLITLFGGMLVTALFYALGRRLRLSNFWAALSAGGITSFAYLAHGVVDGLPGLDVITLHLVAYPTVSVLLYQLYGEKARHDAAMHWAPKLMLGFFALLTVLYGGFVHVASQGLPPAVAAWFLPGANDKRVHTGFAGVVEHDRSAAKGVSQQLALEHRLRSMGWRIEVDGLEALQAERAQPLAVRVIGPDDLGVEGLDVTLQWSRPGQAAGTEQRLATEGGGIYRGTAEPLSSGRWVAHVVIERPDLKPIRIEHTLDLR